MVPGANAQLPILLQGHPCVPVNVGNDLRFASSLDPAFLVRKPRSHPEVTCFLLFPLFAWGFCCAWSTCIQISGKASKALECSASFSWHMLARIPWTRKCCPLQDCPSWRHRLKVVLFYRPYIAPNFGQGMSRSTRGCCQGPQGSPSKQPPYLSFAGADPQHYLWVSVKNRVDPSQWLMTPTQHCSWKGTIEESVFEQFQSFKSQRFASRGSLLHRFQITLTLPPQLLQRHNWTLKMPWYPVSSTSSCGSN